MRLSDDNEIRCVQISPYIDESGVELLFCADSRSAFIEESSQNFKVDADRLKFIDAEEQTCKLKNEAIKQENKYLNLFKSHQLMTEERDALKTISVDYLMKVEELQSSLSQSNHKKHIEKQKHYDLWKKNQSTMSTRDSFKHLTKKHLKQTSDLAVQLEENRHLELGIMQEKKRHATLEKKCKQIALEKDYFKHLAEECAIEISNLLAKEDDNERQNEEHEQLRTQYELLFSERDNMKASNLNYLSNQALSLEEKKNRCFALEREHEVIRGNNSVLEEKVHSFENEVKILEQHLADSELQNLKQSEKDKSEMLKLQKQIDDHDRASRHEERILISVTHCFYRTFLPFRSKQIKAIEAADRVEVRRYHNNDVMNNPTSTGKLSMFVFSLVHRLLYGFRLRHALPTKLIGDFSVKPEDELCAEDKKEDTVQLTRHEIAALVEDM